MRRSQSALLAVAAALLAAAAAYALSYARSLLRPGPPTARARAYVWTESASLRCVVIRDETAVTAPRRQVRFIARPGARLSAGEAFAIAYDDGGEYMRADLLLRLRREAGEAELPRSSPPGSTVLRQEAAELSAALLRGDFSEAGQLSGRLSAELFGPRDTALILREIRALEDAGAGESLFTSPIGAFFSPVADGWERLSPDDFAALTADDLEAVLAVPDLSPKAAGRLIRGGTWLLAALTDAHTAARFTPGDTVALEAGTLRLDAEVIGLRAEADGRAAAIFRCRTSLEDILDLRTLDVEAVTGRMEGLLLPGEALREEDGKTFVYRLAGPALSREAVEPLAELSEGVLVTSSTLRAGQEVFLGDAAAFDGPIC